MEIKFLVNVRPLFVQNRPKFDRRFVWPLHFFIQPFLTYAAEQSAMGNVAMDAGGGGERERGEPVSLRDNLQIFGTMSLLEIKKKVYLHI